METAFLESLALEGHRGHRASEAVSRVLGEPERFVFHAQQVPRASRAPLLQHEPAGVFSRRLLLRPLLHPLPPEPPGLGQACGEHDARAVPKGVKAAWGASTHSLKARSQSSRLRSRWPQSCSSFFTSVSCLSRCCCCCFLCSHSRKDSCGSQGSFWETQAKLC